MNDNFLGEIIAGAGGIVAGALAIWGNRRLGQESRFDAFRESIMVEVRKENADLREQIEVCKRRDARMFVIETCFRMVVPELRRIEPRNRSLIHVSTLLRGLPVENNPQEWIDLLDRVDKADGFTE